jgi:MFS family permease
MLFGWDIGAIGGIIVMPSFKKAYGLVGADGKDKSPGIVANLTSNIVSTLQAGCFLGALIAYYIADNWGRRVSEARPTPASTTR